MVFQHPGEAVGREQKQVARLYGPDVDVGDHVAVRADAARDHVAVGVGARLFGGEVAGVHLLLDVGVVFGDLREPRIALQVGTAVAHLADEEARLEQHERGDRGPHAALVVLGERALEDGRVGRADRVAHAVGDLLVVEAAQRAQLPRDQPYRHLARHFTCRVATHAVGDEKDPPLGDHEVAILVPRPNDADIGPTCAGDMHDRYVRIQYAAATQPSTTIAALAPHPFPFFSAAGGGTGRFGAAFAGDAAAAGGAALGAGAGAGAAGLGAGAGAFNASIILVPPPLATPIASSVGSNTSCTSPKRTMAPGANGASPCTRSPSTNVPLVDSRSVRIQTPSRRCSLACDVETDSSGSTASL